MTDEVKELKGKVRRYMDRSQLSQLVSPHPPMHLGLYASLCLGPRFFGLATRGGTPTPVQKRVPGERSESPRPQSAVLPGRSSSPEKRPTSAPVRASAPEMASPQASTVDTQTLGRHASVRP